jgi:hypothetical protein
LLYGDDYYAAATLIAFEQLAADEPATGIHWVVPIGAAGSVAGGCAVRDAMIESALVLAADTLGWLNWHGAYSIRSIRWRPETATFSVALAGDTESEIVVDRIVSAVGRRPDYLLSSELPIELDGVWEAPARLARAFDAGGLSESRGPAADDANVVLTSEPNFYVLGAKSYGRHPQFSYSAGLQQIRALFSIIGERGDLDLYSTA